ncbi:MAG TPA: NAD(P)-binding domain-containing protein, partial [Bdellovibrio sp.]|nr:NAD(P)-binding domain-containing protein [Bdellovibrio sp.]
MTPMNPLLKAQKIGFLGAGNMAQAMLKGLIEGGIPAHHIYATNRSEGKLIKLKEQFHINTLTNNEELVETCDIIILAVKPQDLLT